MFRMNTYTTDEKFQIIKKKTQVFCFSAPENSQLFLTGWDSLLIYGIVEGGRSSLNGFDWGSCDVLGIKSLTLRQ